MLDALGRYGVFGIVGTQWDSSGGTAINDRDDTDGDPVARNSSQDVVPAQDSNDVVNAHVHVGYASGTRGPPLTGLSAYVNNIKNHPALLGYYLFDVC